MRHLFRKLFLYIACVLVLLVFQSVAPVVYAQKDKPEAMTQAEKDARQKVQGAKGFPLTSSSTDVTGNISVEATLIPAKVASTVFGREVAHNYAIISLTISNRSSDDSFIVHTIFVDYSHWLLSGSSKQSSYLLCPESTSSGSQAKSETAASGETPSGVGDKGGKGQDTDKGKQSPCCPESSLPCGNYLRTWQQQTLPNQISTVETRIVRGELLDKQPWTTRNWVLRALQAVGSIAAGFTFATTNQDWIKGIGAYNAHGIPAGQAFWPDSTVGQMNRISDFGFSVNKVIGKQSSDLVVAFFPIDRFLTPGLRKIFIDSPSVFFSPFGMLLDPNRPALIDQILDPIFTKAPNSPKTNYSDARDLFLGLLPRIANKECDCLQPGCNRDKAGAPPSPDTNLAWACEVANLLDRTSLNTVRVIVGGTMTVDVDKVPPQITEIDVQPPEGEQANTMWTITDSKSKTLTGTIHGSFLAGGTPSITTSNLTDVLEIKGDSQNSNEIELKFTITLKKSLPDGTKTLTFQVTKKSGSTTTSATKDYTVPTQTSASTAGGGAAGAGKTAAPAPETTPGEKTPLAAGKSTAPPTPAPAPQPKK